MRSGVWLHSKSGKVRHLMHHPVEVEHTHADGPRTHIRSICGRLEYELPWRELPPDELYVMERDMDRIKPCSRCRDILAMRLAYDREMLAEIDCDLAAARSL